MVLPLRRRGGINQNHESFLPCKDSRLAGFLLSGRNELVHSFVHLRWLEKSPKFWRLFPVRHYPLRAWYRVVGLRTYWALVYVSMQTKGSDPSCEDAKVVPPSCHCPMPQLFGWKWYLFVFPWVKILTNHYWDECCTASNRRAPREIQTGTKKRNLPSFGLTLDLFFWPRG